MKKRNKNPHRPCAANAYTLVAGLSTHETLFLRESTTHNIQQQRPAAIPSVSHFDFCPPMTIPTMLATRVVSSQARKRRKEKKRPKKAKEDNKQDGYEVMKMRTPSEAWPSFVAVRGYR